MMQALAGCGPPHSSHGIQIGTIGGDVATDLILQAEGDGRCVRDGESRQVPIKAQAIILRNYLLRRV
jgi:hypothetical protein